VGAPTSLAIDLATTLELTLIGFVRAKKFNIYTHSQAGSDFELERSGSALVSRRSDVAAP
jgi:hypothetical protein